MFALLRSLSSSRRLLVDFVRRDLKARYVGSSMGFFWSVIFPIVNLFVFMFVFRLVLKMRWGDTVGEKEVALFMLIGILVWAAFAETVSRATNSLIENANLIQKVVFPSEILPVYLVTSSIVNMLIGIPIVLVGVIFFTDQMPGLALLWVPILCLLQFLFTVGLTYFLATLNLFLRDTYHLVGVGVQVWMFVTPIFYPVEMVREAKLMLPHWLSFLSNAPPGFLKDGTPVVIGPDEGGWFTLDWMLEVNPMHWLIDAWREVVLYNSMPDMALLVRFTVVALLVFVLGAVFFRSQQAKFPDLL